MHVSLAALTIVRNLVFVLYVAHWAACGLYYIARVGDGGAGFGRFGAGTWIGREPEKLASLTSTPQRFLVSLYWAVTTFATVGYGDWFPVSVPEIVRRVRGRVRGGRGGCARARAPTRPPAPRSHPPSSSGPCASC